MSEYITIAGIVQFDPRTRQAGDKSVRDVLIRAIGSNKNFSVTVWPENGHVGISKGDFVVADGKFSTSVGQNKAGEQVTYNNLSATTVICVTGNSGRPAAASQPTATANTGDEFPF